MHKLSLVNFADTEPSEKEFFEEYSKYSGSLTVWFILLFYLRTFATFCLGSQVTILETAKGVDLYMKHFSLECNSSVGFSILLPNCKFEQTDMSVNRLQEVTKKNNKECCQQELALRMGVYTNGGYSFGAIIGGILSDLYGRRSTGLYFSVAWNILAWVFVFVQQKFLSDICYFATIICSSVVNVATFVNFAEIANKKTRLLCIYTLPTYILGGLLTKYLSRTISSWMYQQITIASTAIIMIFACWYIPESPRWLYNKHKKEKAYAQLCEISGLLYTFQLNPDIEDPDPELENNNVLYRMFAFLCHKTKKYLILCNLLMIVSSMSYNSLRVKNILNKIYTDQFDLLTHAAELLSFLFLLPVYMILGKRVGLCFMYVLFLTVLLVTVLTYDIAQAYMDIFGEIFSMTAINIIWLLILDIFPTFSRGTAIGIGFFFFGFSGIFGYILVKLIEKINTFNYYLIFFIANLFGMTVLLLPNTANRELPNYKLR